MNQQKPIRKDNYLMQEALIAQIALERRNGIVPSKVKAECKIDLRKLL